MMNVELVLDARATIGESPTWVPHEHALFWVDVKAPALHRYKPDNKETKRWDLPADIGGFALDGQGRALAALRTGLYWLDLKSSALTQIMPPPFDPQLIRFNESACDSKGRFWVGTMTDPLDGTKSHETGALYSFTESEGLRAYPDFAFITNGMAWNADESIFYLSHSEKRSVFAYPYDLATGRLGSRKIFVQVSEGAGIPDGAAIDAEGGYWCAMHGASALHRYTQEGRLDRVIDLPVSQPTMCCFAGEALEYLYVTSAREKLDETALRREPDAGGLFRLKPGISGQRRNWQIA